MYRHWKLKVVIMQGGAETLPRCDQCGMHMPADRFFKHGHTDNFDKATDKRLWRRDVDMAVRCGKMKFSMEGER